MPPIELETPRLLLRQWQQDDLQPFAELNADAEVMAHFPSCLSQEESDRLASRLQNDLLQRGWGVWAISLKENHAFIGCMGLNIPAPELPVSPCTEILWRLARPYWGQGLALEGARQVLSAGFHQVQLEEIVAFTAQQNQRSQTLMQRLGMRASGLFEYAQVPPDSRFRHLALYRLTRPEFQMLPSPPKPG